MRMRHAVVTGAHFTWRLLVIIISTSPLCIQFSVPSLALHISLSNDAENSGGQVKWLDLDTGRQ